MATPSVEDLVSRMQAALTPLEAERSRWVLETEFSPNQALRPGADEVVRLVIRGLDDASQPGLTESWELLGQMAAGAFGPTTADARVVQEVRLALREAGAAAIVRVSSAAPMAYDFLAVDVIDALLTEADGPLRARYFDALQRFAQRGPRAAKRVRAVFEA